MEADIIQSIQESVNANSTFYGTALFIFLNVIKGVFPKKWHDWLVPILNISFSALVFYAANPESTWNVVVIGTLWVFVTATLWHKANKQEYGEKTILSPKPIPDEVGQDTPNQ